MNVIQYTEKGTYTKNAPRKNPQKTSKIKNYRSRNLGGLYYSYVYKEENKT